MCCVGEGIETGGGGDLADPSKGLGLVDNEAENKYHSQIGAECKRR